MTRVLLTAAVALTAAFAGPSVASASTVTLRMPRDLQTHFPAVYRVKAINLPARTNGYASRQLVAETAVGQIQYSVSENGRIPSRVHPQGARWDGGTWRVRYRTIKTQDGEYGAFRVTKGRRLLKFNGYS